MVRSRIVGLFVCQFSRADIFVLIGNLQMFTILRFLRCVCQADAQQRDDFSAYETYVTQRLLLCDAWMLPDSNLAFYLTSQKTKVKNVESFQGVFVCVNAVG